MFHFARDPLTDLGMPALGPHKDQLPQDLNVTFFFEYVKATVETLEVVNTTLGERVSLGVFNVTNKFETDKFRISIPFPDEGWHNVSIIAKNFFVTENETLLDDVFTYNLTFEIVGKVNSCMFQFNCFNVNSGKSDKN